MLSYQFSFSQVQYIGDFLPLFLTQDKYLKPVSGEQIKNLMSTYFLSSPTIKRRSMSLSYRDQSSWSSFTTLTKINILL